VQLSPSTLWCPKPTNWGFLIEKYGSDHVLLGTDYPLRHGWSDPLGLVNKVSGLSPDAVDRIVGGNAARLLGVER
jgi:aminocarboxymuconate-semialdehyde decarboxylase